jgi:anti-anti-sigma regulatory factor
MTTNLQTLPGASSGVPSRRCGDAGAYSECLSGASEAAVLVAANHLGVAELLLRGAIDEPATRASEAPWLMLLEIFHLTDRRGEYDALLERYRAAFGSPAPAWGFPRPISAPGTFPLKGVLGAQREDLDELARFAYGRKSVAIDMSEVARIDYGFVQALQALLANFAAAGKRVILANVGEINAVLLEAIGADRHAVLMRRHRAGGTQALAA